MTRKSLRFLLATTALGAAVLTMPAVAQTIGIHIENDSTEDFFLSLKDENAQRMLMENERLNGGQRKDVDVLKDGNGRGSVSWTVKSADGAHCDSGNESGLDVGAEVEITAGDSSC